MNQYFRYFNKILGGHIYVYVLFNFFVGLLDGIGIALFIPILSLASKNSATYSPDNTNFIEKFLLYIFNTLHLEFTITKAILLLIGIFLMKGVLVFFKSIYFVKIRLNSIKKLRINLIEGIANYNYEAYVKADIGKLQNNLIGESGRLINSLISYFAYLQNLIMMSTYLLLAIISDYKFTLLVAIGGGITNIIYTYLNKITKAKSLETVTVNNSFATDLIQAFHNFKYLKATNYFDAYKKRFYKTIHESEHLSFSLGRISAFTESLREPLIIIIISIVILVEILYFKVQLGTILISLLMIYRALAYLVTMQNAWNGFLSSSGAIVSIDELYKDFKDNKERTEGKPLHKIENISLKNVGLTIGNTEILNNITIDIEKNQTIGLVGESGAGKTSLVNIISSLIKPTSGAVQYNSQDLIHTDLLSLRNRMGYITQEPVIFDDTIFNNVTFWDEKTEDSVEKFWQVIEMVNLKDFIHAIPDGEETRVGNNGMMISGGQKQRISIARELYKGIDLLIMDEATSALDTETEKIIKDNIDSLSGKLTILIIAHRLSSIKNADNIFLMNKGKIISNGTFDELYQSSSYFKNIVDLQAV